MRPISGGAILMSFFPAGFAATGPAIFKAKLRGSLTAHERSATEGDSVALPFTAHTVMTIMMLNLLVGILSEKLADIVANKIISSYKLLLEIGMRTERPSTVEDRAPWKRANTLGRYTDGTSATALHC